MQRLEWQQELAETPFERMLSVSRLTIELERDEAAATRRSRCAPRSGCAGSRGSGAHGPARGRKRLDEALERLGEPVE